MTLAKREKERGVLKFKILSVMTTEIPLLFNVAITSRDPIVVIQRKGFQTVRKRCIDTFLL